MQDTFDPHLLQEDSAPSFGPMDNLFLGLRLVVLAGGLSWLYFVPLNHDLKLRAFSVFLFYSFYVSVLYVTIFFNLERIRFFYLVGMLFDLLFIFLLLMLTGGAASSFFIAFYILVALHSFYYGLVVGLFVSTASGLIYFVSYVDSGYSMHWTDFALRIFFLYILSISAGLLSRMMRKDREKISLLNHHLEESLKNLEEAQQKLVETAKLSALGRMTSDVAHEIRNPLVSIGGFARKCLHTIDPDSRERRYVQIIVDETARLERILRDLLMFTHGPARELQEINLSKILERGIAMNRDELKEKEIRVVRRIDPALPRVLGDRGQMEKALMNIILNAAQAMDGKGTLTVVTEPFVKDGMEWVRVEIQDTGTGIPSENLDRIFDPFFTTKESAEGTGLGLSVSRRIVEEHHGTISVKSVEGRGSTFVIQIPVLDRGSAEKNTGKEEGE
ncbi:MAG: hypothetical protein GXP58_02650 [Deltaproteobacteria bacterium]|nr:hypothetical protein [Deltaproteobacteria bacterium]